jgi:hypothetical protein
MRAILSLVVAIVLSGRFARAENEIRDVFHSTPINSLSVGQASLFDPNTGELTVEDANTVLKGLLPNVGTKDTFVIHILRWKTIPKDPSALAIDQQHWYVLQAGDKTWGDDDFSKNNRIFGAGKIFFVYFHLNAPNGAMYTVDYTLQATHKTPAYLLHLGQLLNIALTKGNLPAGTTNTFWDYREFDGVPVPSDMDMSGEVFPADGSASITIDKQAFDNEGKYHIDFSVGVPIVKLSDLRYVSASNTLVPATVTREKLFGLFNYYFQPVDIKASGLSWWPHAVAGVALGSRPLQKSLIGVGWGPTLANFYFGLLLNTQPMPQGSACGDTLPSSLPSGTVLKNKTCPQFGFGLNISAGSILDSLTKKK